MNHSALLASPKPAHLFAEHKLRGLSAVKRHAVDAVLAPLDVEAAQPGFESKDSPRFPLKWECGEHLVAIQEPRADFSVGARQELEWLRTAR